MRKGMQVAHLQQRGVSAGCMHSLSRGRWELPRPAEGRGHLCHGHNIFPSTAKTKHLHLQPEESDNDLSVGDGYYFETLGLT